VTVLESLDLGAVYADTRVRMTQLASGLDGDRAGTIVPACPDWTVKDLFAHCAGVCADILAGNIQGVGTDPWTAAHVEQRRDASLQDVLKEWTVAAQQVEPLAPLFPGRSAMQWVGDLASHEHDLRGALDAPGERDSTAVHVGLDFMAGAFVEFALADVPPLVVRAGDWERRSGDGDAVVLQASAFELFRAVTGRRSLNQIRQLDWSGDPEPFLRAFEWGPFHPAADDLIE
jgi:uncharacterized protein (TIGR03083 family)